MIKKTVYFGLMVMMGVVYGDEQDELDRGLFSAVAVGSLDSCMAFIRQGAHVNAQGPKGFTPLMIAAGQGLLAISGLLVVKGANVNASNDQGITAFMLAAGGGHKRVCDLLIEQDIDVNKKGPGGFTAFMFAAENGKQEVCESLLRVMTDDDIDAKNDEDKTALALARSHGRKVIVKLILEKKYGPEPL